MEKAKKLKLHDLDKKMLQLMKINSKISKVVKSR